MFFMTFSHTGDGEKEAWRYTEKDGVQFILAQSAFDVG
jgi:hypothetical protein